ncbi:MAG: spondin domain-containing protein [Planctomycetes bacterium]|nr:spondin domain-containing protein [Planctomycetota bacterium]MCB9909796.1 spondin domain-containing protein [Planctomycetota bacterium]MCB9912295.1 spondin domain-containing protein [Planctomycetota bacterium]HPF12734.1 spondin domain-containing protein [Planctomycetota bacterium]HRV80231.1 spondin domain-containing protein [Planctomycetota bacterium]
MTLARQLLFLSSTIAFASLPSALAQDRIAVSIENMAPNLGTFQTPVWIGVHNGAFNLYDRGLPATGPNSPLGSDALERLAEDGITSGLAMALINSGYGVVEGTVPGPAGPIAPGERAYASFEIQPLAATSRYLSYASMVLPSNDAFVGNGNGTEHPLYNAQGMFVFRDFFDAQAMDAGTEVNDEIPANTAFLGQAAPNTGVPQNGAVEFHAGFLPKGSGGILDRFQFRNADFRNPGFSQIMVRVRRAVAITEDRNYVTLALGSQEVPAVDTPASVRAAFLLRNQGTELHVSIERRMLQNVVAMHVHLGQPGENGPVVLALAGPVPPAGGPANMMVSQQVFTGADLTGPLADYPLDALIAEMEAGNAYLNVHTSDGDPNTIGAPGDNPDGEVRGQLRRQ